MILPVYYRVVVHIDDDEEGDMEKDSERHPVLMPGRNWTKEATSFS